MPSPDRKSRGLLAGLWNRLVAEPFRRTQQESREQLLADGGRVDGRTIIVLLTTAVCLTFIRYLGSGGIEGEDNLESFLRFLGLNAWADQFDAAMRSERRELNTLIYWATSCVTFYLIVPALVVKLVLREKLSDYGLRVRGMFKDCWVYGVMFAFMVPTVLFVSRRGDFLAKYPFYELRPGEPLWPRFLAWELLYALQFVALEFFFRGFLLHGTKKRFGFYSIFVMMVPYCMIHYQKPMLEAFAAIAAGIILGVMSLKTKSIWFGAAIHISVAWTMDATALWRKGII